MIYVDWESLKMHIASYKPTFSFPHISKVHSSLLILDKEDSEMYNFSPSTISNGIDC